MPANGSAPIRLRTSDAASPLSCASPPAWFHENPNRISRPDRDVAFNALGGPEDRFARVGLWDMDSFGEPSRDIRSVGGAGLAPEQRRLTGFSAGQSLQRFQHRRIAPSQPRSLSSGPFQDFRATRSRAGGERPASIGLIIPSASASIHAAPSTSPTSSSARLFGLQQHR